MRRILLLSFLLLLVAATAHAWTGNELPPVNPWVPFGQWLRKILEGPVECYNIGHGVGWWALLGIMRKA